MKSKCLIIMTTHNRLEATKKSIKSIIFSLLFNDTLHYDLCVVDNHSTDGTLLYLMELKAIYKERISLIALDINEGKGAAANYGIFQNIDKFNSYDYFISIDNDIVVPKNCFNVLIDCSRYIKHWALIAPEYTGKPKYHHDVSTDKRYKELKLPNGYSYITKRMGIRGGIWLMNKEFLKKYHGYSKKRIFGLDDKVMLIDTLKEEYSSGIIPTIEVLHLPDKNKAYAEWKRNIQEKIKTDEEYKARESFWK